MCCITEEKAVFFFCFLFLGQDPRWSAIKVNGWKLLTIITKRPILDVAAALDPPLVIWLSAFVEKIKGNDWLKEKMGELPFFWATNEKNT